MKVQIGILPNAISAYLAWMKHDLFHLRRFAFPASNTKASQAIFRISVDTQLITLLILYNLTKDTAIRQVQS